MIEENKGDREQNPFSPPRAALYALGAFDRELIDMAADDGFPDGLLAGLAAFPATLRRQISGLSPSVLDFVPSDWTGSPAENLTIRQQVCHLRDIETDGYHQRIARTLAEERPFLPSIDGHALAVERRYAAEAPAAALGAFEAARAKTIRMLKNVTAGALLRTADFEGQGRVSLLAIVHLLASHDSQHVSGIHWLLARQTASRAA